MKKLIEIKSSQHDWGFAIEVVWDGEALGTGGCAQSFGKNLPLHEVAAELRKLADTLDGAAYR